jgi:hypothetical protein
MICYEIFRKKHVKYCTSPWLDPHTENAYSWLTTRNVYNSWKWTVHLLPWQQTVHPVHGLCADCWWAKWLLEHNATCIALYVVDNPRICSHINSTLKELYYFVLQRWGVVVNLPEWFYCKRTCVLKVYWEGSPSKYSPWAVIHLVWKSCHCGKHF